MATLLTMPRKIALYPFLLGNLLDPHDWSSSDCFAPLLSPLELHLLISISTKMKMVPETGDNNPSFLMMKSTTS